MHQSTPTNTGTNTRQEQLASLARQAGTFRARDLDAHGIARVYLKSLVEKGLLVQVGRGLYTLADAPVTEHQTLLEAMIQVPRGIIALASALRFHGLTTQNPWKVWMLVETGSHIPCSEYPPLLVFQAKGESFSAGIEEHTIDGKILRVTSVAKTIVDCFKYRNKIGMDVALEALKECLQEKKASRDDIRHYAKICRVERIISPYMEAYSQ